MEWRTVGDRGQAATQRPPRLVLGIRCGDAQRLVQEVLVRGGQRGDVHRVGAPPTREGIEQVGHDGATILVDETRAAEP